MKATEIPVPKALQEVWEWKETVYQKTKDMSPEESLAFFERAREEAARVLNCRLVKNPDGSYRFVGKDQDPGRCDEGDIVQIPSSGD